MPSIDINMLINLMDMYVSIDVMMMIGIWMCPLCYLLALVLVHNNNDVNDWVMLMMLL